MKYLSSARKLGSIMIIKKYNDETKENFFKATNSDVEERKTMLEQKSDFALNRRPQNIN